MDDSQFVKGLQTGDRIMGAKQQAEVVNQKPGYTGSRKTEGMPTDRRPKLDKWHIVNTRN